MNLKDLFKKKNNAKAFAKKSLEEIGNEVESKDYIIEYNEKKRRYVPDVDFGDPEQFAFYGQAEEYYTSAIKRIYQSYPYDGSLKEKIQFDNESTHLDNYILKEKYPKYVGYALLHTASVATGTVVQSGYLSSSTPQYIFLSRSLNVDNIFKIADNRESNLLIDGNKGNTVEFWIKKGEFGTIPDQREVIFDNWLSGTDPSADNYGRFKLELKNTGMPFVLTYRSGSSGFHEVEMGGSTLEDSPNLFTASALATFRHETNANTDWQGSSQVTVNVRNNGIGDNSWYIEATASDGGFDAFGLAPRLSLGDYRISFDAKVVAGTLGDYFLRSWVATTTSPGLGVLIDDSTNQWTRVVLDATTTDVYPNVLWRFYAARVGSAGDTVAIDNLQIHALPAESTTFADNTWHHYALTVVNSGSSLVAKLYRDGNKIDEVTKSNASVDYVSGSMIGRIGTLAAPFSSSVYWTTSSADVTPQLIQTTSGYGQLSASLDEFRYWKRARTGKEIARYYFTQVGGGTNTDDANTDLGVYYKFNEGNVGSNSTDKNVLDYSGRLSNGTWIGFVSGSSRQSGSAIIESSASFYEFRDPIIYEYHPEVKDLIEDLTYIGREWDYRNNASMYRSFPDYIIQGDQEKDRHILLELTQILSSYFDTAHLQIKNIPRIAEARYFSGSTYPLHFANRILESSGMIVPDIFVDADILEEFAKRSDTKNFKEELYNIKNTIYQNIYNNISYIFKSKGTEKAFRNLIRCFGIDDELLKINMYTNNNTYTLKSNYRNSAFKKKYVDFNDPTRFGGTVYSSASLSGSFDLARGMTFEADVLFPKKYEYYSTNYFVTSFFTSSLMGAHQTDHDLNDTTWTNGDQANFQVYAIRNKSDSPHVYFLLTGSAGGFFPELSSSLKYDVYDNRNWNISVRISPQKDKPYFIGTTTDYLVEFYGANVEYGIVQDSFYVTGTITGSNAPAFLTGSKRFYVGAERSDFTGTLQQYTDVRIGEARVWSRRLEDEEIIEHARDLSSYGSLRPSQNAFGPTTGSSVMSNEALMMQWRFDTLTASDDNGNFDVFDFASSSLNQRIEVNNINYPGIGYGFASNATGTFNTEYVQSFKLQHPEIQNSSDMISIIESDTVFTKETRPLRYYFAVEKSMQQAMNDEILRSFASIKDFHNLIGEPVNRYRSRYKKLDYLRELYFSKVDTVADFEKFIEIYKWIDDSISTMVEQLIPASADFSEDVRTLIESHVLERNKYQSVYPETERKDPDPSGRVHGINELKFNWKFGHHPVSNSQLENPTYWRLRHNPEDPPISSSAQGVNFSKQKIYAALTESFNRKFDTPYDIEISIDKEVPKAVVIDYVGPYLAVLSKRILVLDANYAENTYDYELSPTKYKQRMSFKIEEN